MTSLSYRGHRFPAPIIQHAIWLYIRFTLRRTPTPGGIPAAARDLPLLLGIAVVFPPMLRIRPASTGWM
jgi:hypothetical protein